MNDSIFAGDLPRALDAFPQVTILSLDCFDTLLWRDTHAPRDVFRTLEGLSPMQRVWAEQRARNGAMLRSRRNEVGLAAIYADLLPNASADQRAAMIAQELDAEARHCFGFLPTIELMRNANARGLSIIVVSDTYLDAVELGDLIARAAGEDVRAMIDRIFCSSEYGISKGEGLLDKVRKVLGVSGDTVLHLGDNRAADLLAGQRAGLNALHLKQFTSNAEQRLRLEAATSAILHTPDLHRAMNAQPHRAPISIAEPVIQDQAELLGYSAIGPVMHGFAEWISAEATAVAGKGRTHLLFLMRDGHLPRLVFDALHPGSGSHAIEISRFTSMAASFGSERDVLRYLETEMGTDPSTILAQLLFQPSEIGLILRTLPASASFDALVRIIRKPHRLRRIVKRSQEFANRLCDYLRATVAPAAGDTLMLVDLGYNGSVQNMIEPVLRRMLDVDVCGRYLLLREQDVPELDKRGFIDARHYDAAMLEALCTNVAVLEQLCTAAQGSVVNYSHGEPVRAANSIKGAQSETREAVQRGAIRYAHEATRAIIRATPSIDAEGQRCSAAAVLARLMFLPLADELAVLAKFQHDINLGVDQTVALFDPAIARRGMRQRGLFYLRGSERMYLPAELHGEGLSVKMTLFAQRRFGLALKYTDFIDQTITLPVLIADGRNVDAATITATPTHDGYFLAAIPIDDCRFAVGLQFGRLYEWLQVESVVFMPVDRFLSEKQRAGAEQVDASPTLEGMERTGPHLFRCEDAAAFMMIPPPARKDGRPMMLAVVFRPIVARPPVQTPAPVQLADAGSILKPAR